MGDGYVNLLNLNRLGEIHGQTPWVNAYAVGGVF